MFVSMDVTFCESEAFYGNSPSKVSATQPTLASKFLFSPSISPNHTGWEEELWPWRNRLSFLNRESLLLNRGSRLSLLNRRSLLLNRGSRLHFRLGLMSLLCIPLLPNSLPLIQLWHLSIMVIFLLLIVFLLLLEKLHVNILFLPTIVKILLISFSMSPYHLHIGPSLHP